MGKVIPIRGRGKDGGEPPDEPPDKPPQEPPTKSPEIIALENLVANQRRELLRYEREREIRSETREGLKVALFGSVALLAILWGIKVLGPSSTDQPDPTQQASPENPNEKMIKPAKVAEIHARIAAVETHLDKLEFTYNSDGSLSRVTKKKISDLLSGLLGCPPDKLSFDFSHDYQVGADTRITCPDGLAMRISRLDSHSFITLNIDLPGKKMKEMIRLGHNGALLFHNQEISTAEQTETLRRSPGHSVLTVSTVAPFEKYPGGFSQTVFTVYFDKTGNAQAATQSADGIDSAVYYVDEAAMNSYQPLLDKNHPTPYLR